MCIVYICIFLGLYKQCLCVVSAYVVHMCTILVTCVVFVCAMCMYSAHVHDIVYMCSVCVCHVHVYTWFSTETQGLSQLLSLNKVYIYLWRQSLAIQLVCLPTIHLFLQPSTKMGLQSCSTMPSFLHRCLGSKFRSSCFH